MKRKFLYSLLIATIGFGLVACGNENTEEASTEENEQIANPWTDTTLEEIEAKFGTLPLPAGHTNDVCTICEDEGIAQVEFTLDGEADSFTFRVEATDSLTDISGMYYEWTASNDDEINGCEAKYCSYVGDDGDAQVYYWYDSSTKETYSISVTGTDLNGIDLYGIVLMGLESDADAADSAEEGVINPLPTAVDITDLTDCTVNVSFTLDDFNWNGSNLTVHVYDEILYDAVDISGLAVGDIIVADGQEIEVQTLSDTEYCRMINEGLADQLMLAPGDGGTYYIAGYDDTVGMTELGEAELILSEDVVLNDCGEMPEDAYEISADELKAYLEGLSEGRQSFGYDNTTVVIEGGEVTEIDRAWRP